MGKKHVPYYKESTSKKAWENKKTPQTGKIELTKKEYIKGNRRHPASTNRYK